MNSHFFAMLARMKYINRWALMRNVQEESICQHSMETAAFAHALALIKNRLYAGNLNADRAALLALYHDMPEIITGDLPTPVKYYNPEIKDAYKAVEAFSADKLTALLPEDLQSIFAPLLKEESDPETHELVKAADKLSAYIKCVEELSAGNEEYRQAEKQIKASLEASSLPEVAYFMEQFMPAFGLTLDELQR